MNDTQFDKALRAALPTPSPSYTLDRTVDRALAGAQRTRRINRRMGLSFATAAATILGMVALPAVQAHASLSGIVSALDKQTRVKITTFSVANDGSTRPSATTTIANGDVAYVDSNGTRQNFDIGDKTYALDPTIGKFIVRPRRPSRSLRLSNMLGPAGEFSFDKRAEIERLTIDGRAIVRATIVNKGLPERYIIDADAFTDLPVSSHVDALERGVWHTRHRLVFDYDAKVSAPKPNFRRYPITTDAAANLEFGTAMTRSVLGEMPLGKGRVVIRKLDVAADGTVFVAFQTGDRRPNSWRGYTFDIKNEGGVRYLRYGQIFGSEERPFMSEDGKMEIEMFVPAVSIAPRAARPVILTALRTPDGGLGRKYSAESHFGDGTVWKGMQADGFAPQKPLPKGAIVLRRPAMRPTCEAAPSWAARLDFTRFGNPIAAEMEKANVRAQCAMEAKDWREAEKWLDEQLRLIREHERQGYGSWSQSDVLNNLDKVRAAQRP